MSGSGGSAVSRSNSVARFYNPPMRRYHKSVLHQQQPLPQLQKAAARLSTPVDGGNRIDSEDSPAALSKQPPVSAPSARPRPPPPPNLTNLDRFLESVAPTVAASEVQVNARRRKTKEPKLQQPFYCLSDLWESFNEWSVYGVGVSLLLNGVDHVQQYYVSFLLGIQLYVDPTKHHLRVRFYHLSTPFPNILSILMVSLMLKALADVVDSCVGAVSIDCNASIDAACEVMVFCCRQGISSTDRFQFLGWQR